MDKILIQNTEFDPEKWTHSYESKDLVIQHIYAYENPKISIILLQPHTSKEVVFQIFIDGQFVGGSAQYSPVFENFVEQFIKKCGFVHFLMKRKIRVF